MDEKNNSSAAGAAPRMAGQAAGRRAGIASDLRMWREDVRDDQGDCKFKVHPSSRANLAADLEKGADTIDALLAALKVAQKLAAGGLSPAPASDPRWVLIADAIEKAEGVASVSASAEGGSHSPNSPAVLASKGA